MLYYDLKHTQILNDADLIDSGHSADDQAVLAETEIFPLTIEKPDYDAVNEGIEPDGNPQPDVDKPGWWVQRMKVYSLVEYFKATLKAQATERRWIHETGGIKFPDTSKPPVEIPVDWPENRPKPQQPMVRINTTIDDQNRIATAIQGMADAKITEVDFKAASGWLRLTREQLAEIAAMIAAHVQACFTKERALHEAIEAVQTMEELNALDVNMGWPGQAERKDTVIDVIRSEIPGDLGAHEEI
ncbi:MAG: DUF4376 domain-containing protein [Anaerovorax sp.]